MPSTLHMDYPWKKIKVGPDEYEYIGYCCRCGEETDNAEEGLPICPDCKEKP